MSPRRYEMSKRRQAVEQTRARILDATMQLHAEQGILATSWEDIAARAQVSVGTVYRHFPTLDVLVPACGAASRQRLELPDARAARAAFDGLDGAEPRIERLMSECYRRYETAGHVLQAVRRDREREALADVAGAHAEIEEALDLLVAAALAPLGVEASRRRVVRALCDFDTWNALRRQGLTPKQAVASAAELALRWVA